MKDLARRGAQARLAELVAEMDAILGAFPDLGKGASPTSGGKEGPKAVGGNKGHDASGLGTAEGRYCRRYVRDSGRRGRTRVEEGTSDVGAGARENQRGAEEALGESGSREKALAGRP